MTTLDIRDAPASQRYEAYLDDELVGYSDYRENDGVVSFTHALVFPEYGGRGIASELARVSLDGVRTAGNQTVRPVCSFYRWYIDQHPEYADLVAPGR